MDAALFELLLFFGVVLGLAFWELWRTPRPGRDEKDDDRKPDG